MLAGARRDGYTNPKMSSAELRVLFIRNGESHVDAGRPKQPNYPLLPEGAEKAKAVGRHLRTILGCPENKPPHIVAYVHDGTNRAAQTLAIATGYAGLPGTMRKKETFDHGERSHECVRGRVEEYLQKRREEIEKMRQGWEIVPEVELALNSIWLVVATSHQTIATVVGSQIGVVDDEIDSEHPRSDGTLTKPTPNIPFGSVTELIVKQDGLFVVHAGLSPEAAAEWAMSSRGEPPKMRRQAYGVPHDRPPEGKRYARSVPPEAEW